MKRKELVDSIAAFSKHPSLLRGTLEDKLEELLAFIEEDAKAWDDAAQYCEELANGLPEPKRAECNLTCAVYRERAKLHREMVAKLRQS